MWGLETFWNKRKTVSDLQMLKLNWVSNSKGSLSTCTSSETKTGNPARQAHFHTIMWDQAKGRENETENNSLNPEMFVRSQRHTEDSPSQQKRDGKSALQPSALWNAKASSSLSVTLTNADQKDPFPPSCPASVDHTGLIKHTVQLFAWHDLSTNQRCYKPVFFKSQEKKKKKKAQATSLGIPLRPSSHSQVAAVISAMTQPQRQNKRQYFMLYRWH